VALGLDLALGGETGSDQGGANRFPQSRLGQEQEVVLSSPHHDERSDHPTLRREQERLARRACDLVRQHALEEIARVRPTHGDVVAWPERSGGREGLHRN
jgi:hypothetical protein